MSATKNTVLGIAIAFAAAVGVIAWRSAANRSVEPEKAPLVAAQQIGTSVRTVSTTTSSGAPEVLPLAAPLTDSLLASYDYVPGNTYAEYLPGSDKLATYGLTALVVGGGAAALIKSGLLARFWKPLVVAFVALGAGIKRLFTSGRSSKHGMDEPIG